MSTEALWYSSYHHGKPPVVRKLSRADLADKTLPYRIAIGRLLGTAGFRSVGNLDGTTTWSWPRRTGQWWALPEAIIDEVGRLHDLAIDEALRIYRERTTNAQAAEVLRVELRGIGGIEMLMDTRITEILEPVEAPDPLPPKLRDRVRSLQSRRREAPDDDVPGIDWMLIELCQPIP